MKLKNISSLFLIFSTCPAWAAPAASTAASQANQMSQFIIMAVLLAAFYFFMIRPQNKRAKEHRNMIAALAKDDEVVTGGGLVGRVTKVTENFVRVAIADNVEVTVQRGMIASCLPKGTLKTIN